MIGRSAQGGATGVAIGWAVAAASGVVVVFGSVLMLIDRRGLIALFGGVRPSAGVDA